MFKTLIPTLISLVLFLPAGAATVLPTDAPSQDATITSYSYELVEVQKDGTEVYKAGIMMPKADASKKVFFGFKGFGLKLGLEFNK